jgi:hypothetical protein
LNFLLVTIGAFNEKSKGSFHPLANYFTSIR